MKYQKKHTEAAQLLQEAISEGFTGVMEEQLQAAAHLLHGDLLVATGGDGDYMGSDTWLASEQAQWLKCVTMVKSVLEAAAEDTDVPTGNIAHWIGNLKMVEGKEGIRETCLLLLNVIKRQYGDLESAMLFKLRIHLYRNGWEDCSVDWLLGRLLGEYEEYKDIKKGHNFERLMAIADVANFAAMAWDILGRQAPSEAKAKPHTLLPKYQPRVGQYVWYCTDLANFADKAHFAIITNVVDAEAGIADLFVFEAHTKAFDMTPKRVPLLQGGRHGQAWVHFEQSEAKNLPTLFTQGIGKNEASKMRARSPRNLKGE